MFSRVRSSRDRRLILVYIAIRPGPANSFERLKFELSKFDYSLISGAFFFFGGGGGGVHNYL